MSRQLKKPAHTQCQNQVDHAAQSKEGPGGAGLVFHPAFVCALLALVTLAVFWPVTGYEFIGCDDPRYVTENEHVLEGMTWSGWWWAWKTMEAGFWQPLTWLTHMADVQVYGLRAGGHHLTNLLLHVANTVLLFLLLRRMTGALWRSAMVAGLFALHPLHVEPVAWVASRKDVLSTLFWMLTLLMYVRYVGEFKVQSSKSKIFYGLALLFFMCGLMSKTMVVTLPAVMLLLDWWPLGRVSSFKIQAPSSGTPARHDPRPSTFDLRLLWRLVREKIPFLVLSVVMGMVTVYAEQGAEALASAEDYPLVMRVGNALRSFVLYLRQTCWPVDLALFYPYQRTFSIWGLGGGIVLLGGLSMVAWRERRRCPALLAGWLWFGMTLLPVLGIIQVGAHGRADRYTYVPLIGVFIMLAWGAAVVLDRWPMSKRTVGWVAVLILAACAVRTRVQLGHWRNNETVFRHAMTVTDNNELAYINYGDNLLRQGFAVDAAKYFQKTLEINPKSVHAHFNLGGVLAQLGQLDEAARHYDEAIRIKPGLVAMLETQGDKYAGNKQYTEAMACYEAVLRAKPEQWKAHFALGNTLAALGKIDEAVAQYREALRYRPDDADGRYDLGYFLMTEGRLGEAVSCFEEALRLNPGHLAARFNLGNALAMQKKYSEAAEQFAKVVRSRPDYAPAYKKSGNGPGAFGTAG